MVFKVLLFPVSLVLTVFVVLSSFLVEKCAILLNICSGLLFIGSILCFLQYFFGWPFGASGSSWDLQGGIITAVMAFIISPYGLPNVLVWIIERFDDLNELIKSI
jgi:hypothetical protein